MSRNPRRSVVVTRVKRGIRNEHSLQIAGVEIRGKYVKDPAWKAVPLILTILCTNQTKS